MNSELIEQAEYRGEPDGQTNEWTDSPTANSASSSRFSFFRCPSKMIFLDLSFFSGVSVRMRAIPTSIAIPRSIDSMFLQL